MTIGGTATTIEITVMSDPAEAQGEARVAAKDSSAHYGSPLIEITARYIVCSSCGICLRTYAWC